MTTLATLKRHAQRLTTRRGHRMRWAGNCGVCRDCRMDVQLLVRPRPNEVDISGPAIARECNAWAKEESTC
jgi:hypothetical protein